MALIFDRLGPMKNEGLELIIARRFQRTITCGHSFPNSYQANLHSVTSYLRSSGDFIIALQNVTLCALVLIRR